MKKIGVVGHFGGTEAFFDGQTVKTKNLYNALLEEFGEENINVVDTYYFRKNPLTFLFKALKLFFFSKNVIMLPDSNGVRIFVPLYYLLNLCLNKKLHYVVVGGWLPELLSKHKVLRFFAKKLDALHVETTSMITDLKAQGFDNVYFLPNFKYITPLKEDELIYNKNAPHNLCIFSRIMKEKGVEDAIDIVKQINDEAGKTVFTLDLYGPIDDGYKTRFEEVKANMPEYVSYKGIVDSEKSVDAIKNYFALIFPTKFYTEGVPGTLIDAMAAGIPVISSLWVNHNDVFVEGVTGWGYEFDNVNEFKQLLKKAAKNPNKFLSMKKTALCQFEKYNPAELISVFIENLR